MLKTFKRRWIDALILAAIAAATLAGVFEPMENALRNIRYAVNSHPASGDIVLVAIDPQSLNEIGTWPWPRRVHAALIDRLVEADTGDIFFDIDFSTRSTYEDDVYLASALKRAGGFVALAAFRQPETINGQGMAFNVPIPDFTKNAGIAVVNVEVDGDGVARRYPYGTEIDGVFYNSVATLLGRENRDAANAHFRVDYSIDIKTIDSISAADVLNGKIDPARLQGRDIVIGASALELRDTFAVPRWGVMPGPLLQIMGAETLKQNRALQYDALASRMTFLALVALVFFTLRRFVSFKWVVLAGIGLLAAGEFASLVLLRTEAVLFDTMGGHATLIALAVLGVARELDISGLLLRQVRRDHDVTKGILKRVIADNFDGVIVVDAAGHVLTASHLAENLLGFELDPGAPAPQAADILPAMVAAEIRVALDLGKNFRADRDVREVAITGHDGQIILLEYVITLSHVEDENRPGDGESQDVACLTFRDVTERRANEQRLSFLAAHDPLTTALSRARLVELVDGAMSTPDGQEVGMSIYVVDLSRFKMVNETLGHSMGDDVLRQVYTRLSQCDAVCVARLGGDTFALARAGISGREEVESFCAGIIERLSETYLVGEHRIMLGAFVGVADSDTSGYKAEMLISHADMALSAARGNPVDRFAVFSTEMDERLHDMRQMEIALRNAIRNDEFSVTFQPQVDLDTRRLTGAEALMRWTHPVLGPVSPAKFVPVAEETGLIVDVGRWVLEASCKEAAGWPAHLQVAVNVSPTQFEFGDLLADVQKALRISGLAPERLVLEITEGVLISNSELVISKLRRLKALGLTIALDDFGTGYSSLAYLGKLPIDKIKIDQAFVRGLPNDQQGAAVVRAVMTLSESLGKKVVAEGIETKDQAWMLKLAGCHYGQGYLYGKPLDALTFRKKIRAEAENGSWLQAG